jgi:hypothetical protein
VTKSDFIDWKRHPATQQVFSHLQAKVAGLKDEILAAVVSQEFHLAAIKAGAVIATEDMLNTTYEETHGD